MTQYLKVHFLSQRGDWKTPTEFYKELNREFHFTMDACATKTNHKHRNYISRKENALKVNWKAHGGGVTFMNPPYGREIGKWVAKAYQESLNRCLVVCLLPARPDTKWFHEICSKAAEIRFIKGRLRFEGAKFTAPSPSMVVIFKKKRGECAK